MRPVSLWNMLFNAGTRLCCFSFTWLFWDRLSLSSGQMNHNTTMVIMKILPLPDDDKHELMNRVPR